MRLWLLVRKGDVGYDEYDSFVIRAQNETSARYMASQSAADEGRDVWLEPSKSTCTPVYSAGNSEVILSSFRAG